jgi:hypothetical protein
VPPTSRSSWLLRGASVPGASHLQEARSSQDAFSTLALSHPEGDLVALVVADGAGSAARASDGAAIAVSSALASVRRGFMGALPTTGQAWRDRVETIAGDTVAQLRATADALQGCCIDDLSCTLGIALLSTRWLASLVVGDTFCVVRRRDGGLHLLAAPTHPDGDPSQTVFIAHPDWRAHSSVAILEDDEIDACALSSDGLEPSALLQTATGIEPYGPFLNPIFDGARTSKTSAPLARFLLCDDQLGDTTDDDRTLLMAVRT